jgi:hypothetical protein
MSKPGHQGNLDRPEQEVENGQKQTLRFVLDPWLNMIIIITTIRNFRRPNCACELLKPS